MAAPFFVQKKFLKYYGLFLLLLLLIGIAWTVVNYFESEAQGSVRWDKITIPLTLPIFGVVGYILLSALWLRTKVAERGNGLPDLYTPTPTLSKDEVQYGDSDQVGYSTHPANTIYGEICFTNQRLIFTEAVDLKRVAQPNGTQIPELITSFPWNQIRQCRFGMHDERLKFCVVILNDKSEHTFGPVVKFNLELSMRELKWARKEITEYTYWTRQ